MYANSCLCSCHDSPGCVDNGVSWPGGNSMLLLFKCDILDRSSPLWGSCWGLVSPFGSLRMSSQSNLFLWKRGRGGAWVWGELFSSFSFFGQYYMGVNSFSTKEASFLCLSTFQISESACRPGFHSGISVFSVDGGFKVFFFFPSDTGPYVVLQATSLSLQDSLLHFSLSRFWGIPMDALSF